MLRHVMAFEARYQLKSPAFATGAALFFLLTFGSVTVDQIQIGSRGNVHVNSPYAILQTLGVMSVFGVFVIAALVANVVVRDDETGFAPIVRSTSISKASYLLGRFLGATLAALAFLACVPLAVALGAAMPWLDAERIGPFRPGDYLYALLGFGLPTVLIVASSLFALATVTRSMAWTYVGTVAMLVLYLVMRGLLRDPQYDTLSSLLDPFGLSALATATRYWTAAERNGQLPALRGLLLANRVLWASVGVALFAVAYRRFRFEERGQRAAPAPASHDEAPAVAVARPGTPRGQAHALTQLWRLTRFDLAFVLRSPAFLVLMALGVLNSVAQMATAGEQYGSASYPATRLMVRTLLGAFSLFPILVSVYYAGELVWRDRERRTHELVDATSAPDWTHLVPKISAIALVLFVTGLMGVTSGVAVQLARGYHAFELGHYLQWFVAPTTITALHLAVLAVFVQVLVPQKFLGWAVMLLYIVASVALDSAGFEHDLYSYAGLPHAPLSDFNGRARFWIGQAWFQLYWSLFAIILATLAHGLWRRGSTVELIPRLRQLPRRLRGGAGLLLAASAVAWAASGVWIFYNTNLLERYRSGPAADEHRARYERDLLPYASVPQPRVTAVTLDVQLYPREARAVTRGQFTLENRTAAPIDTLHVRWSDRLRVDAFAFPGATLERDYPEHRYTIHRLSPPLAPGEARPLSFTTTLEERGFSVNEPLTSIVDNGTFLHHSDISPLIGMSTQGLLRDRAKRRKYKLPSELRMASRDDDRARAHHMLAPDSDWVDADLTLTTDADQTPLAPGEVVSDVTTGARRTARFRPHAPINHFFSLQSARYAVAHDRLDDIDLSVFYHPAHAHNVGRMLGTMKESLALFGKIFSPYQFKQARVIEFPAYADYAQSFAGTIPYSENVGFLARLGGPEKIDMVTYITAHEIAHQWWGHQIVPADQQGSTMLVETFAQYSALLVMEQHYGRDHVRRFLKYELDQYLRTRGTEAVEEVPLARVENQPYIHYQKGTLVMYWLREVVGEEAVNRALAKLLAAHAFRAAPYPNTLDFLRLLRAEAGPAHDALIDDLFEKITLYDVKTTSASATRRPDGTYEVRCEVEAHKLHADGKGVETEAPLDEPFELGVFTSEPGKADFSTGAVVAMERRPLRSGRQTLSLVVDREPRFVGVDPYNKRIDRNSNDNVIAIPR